MFVDKNVLDNIPYEKTSASLKRLNTSGSKSSKVSIFFLLTRLKKVLIINVR